MKPETELRELDLWISEHVFGFSKIEKESPRRWRVRYRIEPGFEGCGCGGFKSPEAAAAYLWYQVKHPTTIPAAAMAVLEKCLGKLPRSIEISFDADSPGAGYFISRTDDDASQAIIADTLPLAIAKFARQLFSA